MAILRFSVATLFLVSASFTRALESGGKNSQAVLRAHEQALDGTAALVPSSVFPVPTSSRCIVIMCCQYMIIYTALAVCRTYHELRGTSKGSMESALRAAAQTLTYGPMLCVLFIACRMRVEFLSGGESQPPMWVQNCMFALTFAVLASTLLVLAVPLITGNPPPPQQGTCDMKMPEPEDKSKAILYTLTVTRYLVLFCLYAELAGLIVGTCTYVPAVTKDLNKLPASAPAIACTMILAVLFFPTQLIIAVCRSYTEFSGVAFPKIIGMMHAAATTVEFAPQLSILFLAARMRALQHDSQPQMWAQYCMIAATVAVCLTTVLAIIAPVCLCATMSRNRDTGEVNYETPHPMPGYIMVAFRYLYMLVFYGGAVGVAISIFTFEAPGGAEATLPVSPAVQCVVNLTCQFFFVYLMMTVMLTVSEANGGHHPLEKWALYAAIESSKATLAFAPMLSVLFVTTRMYALQISDNRGAPQAWVQDGMFVCTWALLISCLMCLATALLMDKVETDYAGNVVNKFTNQYVAIAVTCARYLTMLLLYGGMITVIVGLFVMTPETANGRGSIPLVTDVVNGMPI